MNAEQAKCPDCKGRGTKPHPHIPRYVRVDLAPHVAGTMSGGGLGVGGAA